MRILIIEDEKDIVLPLKKTLEKYGYAVDFAFDGKEGYNLARLNKYDCILLDLNLPGMDGLELCKQLRKISMFLQGKGAGREILNMKVKIARDLGYKFIEIQNENKGFWAKMIAEASGATVEKVMKAFYKAYNEQEIRLEFGPWKYIGNNTWRYTISQ